MKLVELIVAGTVLAVASTSSLQMAASSAGLHRGTLEQEQRLEQIERDRLLLQASWQRAELQGQTCEAVIGHLVEMATEPPPPNGVHRQVETTADGLSLRVIWQNAAEPQASTTAPAALRERVITPAGLGLCIPDEVNPAATESDPVSSDTPTPTEGSLSKPTPVGGTAS